MARIHMRSFVIGVMVALGAAVFFAATQLDSHQTQQFSHYTGIDGIWYNDSGNKVRVNVRHDGHVDSKNLATGGEHHGQFEGPWLVKFENGKTLSLSHGGRKAVWSDGHEWTRYPRGKTHVSGTWYKNDHPIKVKIFDNGWGFQATFDDGTIWKGHAGGAHSLVVPSKNLTGHINDAANTIHWSNGKLWTRTPGGSGGGPLRAPNAGG